MGNVIPPDSRKEIEVLANSMLTTFDNEYRVTYGCEVLRLNEESQEHKFSLNFCPWERLQYPIKKGYLTKQGYIRKSWKKRYFVVQPNYLIDYYENEEAFENGMKPKGVIHPCGYKVVSNLRDVLAKRQKELAVILGVDQQETPEKYPEHTFGVVHEKARSYFITAENEEEKLEWVKVFQLCCACVKGFSIDNDPVCQSTYNKAISRTLMAFGNQGYHSYKGTEEKILCDLITTEIEGRLLAGVYQNIKGNFSVKTKIRDQVLKDLDLSVLTLVRPMWKILMEDKEKLQLKAEAILREKGAEVANVRRKIEYEMSGKTEAHINEALAEVKKYAQRISPILEKSMVDALCEVLSIYQFNIVEIGIDIEQRGEEVEIPLQMYIDSLDMLARTPSEMETVYEHLEEMKTVLEEACGDLNSFDVSAIVSEAEEKLRMVMDALVNTFQQKFLSRSREIEGNQNNKLLRNLIEEVDEDVANNFEADLKEIINTFNLKILMTIFVPFVHKNVDSNCKMVIEEVDDVIPNHLRPVLTLDGEYERLVERSVEQSLKKGLISIKTTKGIPNCFSEIEQQHPNCLDRCILRGKPFAINITDESKQWSFLSSMRNSRRKTFPKFISCQTKFQTGYKRSEDSSCVSLPTNKSHVLGNERRRKSSLGKLIGLGCLSINGGDYRKSNAYMQVVNNSSAGNNLEETISKLDIQNDGNTEIKR